MTDEVLAFIVSIFLFGTSAISVARAMVRERIYLTCFWMLVYMLAFWVMIFMGSLWLIREVL